MHSNDLIDSRKEEVSPSESTATLTAQIEAATSTVPTLANPESDEVTPTSSIPTSPRGEWRIVRRPSTLSEKDRSNEKDMTARETEANFIRRVSNVTLTNVSDEEMCSKSDPVEYFLYYIICICFLHSHSTHYIYLYFFKVRYNIYPCTTFTTK